MIRRNRRLRQAVDFRKSFRVGDGPSASISTSGIRQSRPSPRSGTFLETLGQIQTCQWIRLVDAPFTATAKEMVPVTCTHKASEFLRRRSLTASFWEAGPEFWHNRYSDDLSRAHILRRRPLREEARYLVYGILVNPNAVDTLLPLDLCLATATAVTF